MKLSSVSDRRRLHATEDVAGHHGMSRLADTEEWVAKSWSEWDDIDELAVRIPRALTEPIWGESISGIQRVSRDAAAPPTWDGRTGGVLRRATSNSSDVSLAWIGSEVVGSHVHVEGDDAYSGAVGALGRVGVASGDSVLASIAGGILGGPWALIPARADFALDSTPCPEPAPDCSRTWQTQPRDGSVPCAAPPDNPPVVVIGLQQDLRPFVGCPGYIVFYIDPSTPNLRDLNDQFIGCAVRGLIGGGNIRVVGPPVVVAGPGFDRETAQLIACDCGPLPPAGSTFELNCAAAACARLTAGPSESLTQLRIRKDQCCAQLRTRCIGSATRQPEVNACIRTFNDCRRQAGLVP